MVMLLYQIRFVIIGSLSLCICVNSLIQQHHRICVASSLLARSQRMMAVARGSEAWLDATVSSVDRSILEELFHSSLDQSLFVDSILTLQDDDSNSISALLTGFSDKFHKHSPHQYIQVGSKLLDKNNKKVVGVVVEVDSAEGQERARSLVGSVEWIVLHCIGDWTMIPVENLIAACMNTGTKLAVFVDKAINLPGVYYALQTGPDAVILSPNKELWNAYAQLRVQAIGNGIDSPSANDDDEDNNDNDPEDLRIKTTADDAAVASIVGCLDEAVITEVKSGMIGDRICLDLIQSLEDGEGLLIGSSAKILCIVHGETLEGEFVPARPFRVNAGPVHSYVLMADGSTKYLSEVQAGDMVAVVNNIGAGIDIGSEVSFRPVAVGRCKKESRPVLLISFQHTVSDRKGTIFLQQAETVRLVAPLASNFVNNNKLWRVLPVTDAKIGDKIYMIMHEMGTHVGKRINARVSEV